MVNWKETTLGEVVELAKDLLGRVYEFFLGEFANAKGKKTQGF